LEKYLSPLSFQFNIPLATSTVSQGLRFLDTCEVRNGLVAKEMTGAPNGRKSPVGSASPAVVSLKTIISQALSAGAGGTIRLSGSN
jgi:hypothetical protein